MTKLIGRVVLVGVLLTLAVGVSAVQGAEETMSTVRTSQSGEAELSQTLDWYEMGLTMQYPSDWQFTLDERFDFALVGPEDTTSNFPYLLMQSGGYPYWENSLADFLISIIGVSDTSELTSLDLANIEAYRFTSINEGGQTVVYVGFAYTEGQLGLMSLVAPADQGETWTPVFESMLASLTIEPLTLDTELLNRQMQESFERDGTLTVGDPNAPLLMVEFFDFSCPHCVEFSHKVDRMVEDYVLTGKLRIEITVLDIIGGEISTTAGVAMVCGAKLGYGWDLHQLIFSEYEREAQGRAAYTRENLVMAIQNAELGLDLGAFEACMVDPAMVEVISANNEFAGVKAVNSTPTMMFGANRADVALVSYQEGGVEFHAGFPLMVLYEYFDTFDTTIEESE